MKPVIHFLLCLLIAASAHAKDERNLAVNQVNNAVSDKRIALVIGNSSYTNSPLKNPVNDAKDMAAKLRGLGFDVIERSNLQTKQIGGTLREFRSKLAPGAVALVFYAGHGLQIKGVNYLPAVDADINSEEDVPNQSLGVNQIMDVLDESKTRLNLVFLDACRNNPYARSFRSSDKGLARVAAPSGTLISYATKPGSVAADGDGRNGLYTSKLLAQMDSTIQVELTLKRVVTEVKAASQGKQEPWMEGSIEGDFCFGGCITGEGTQVASLVPVPVQPARIKSKEEIEQDSWDSVRDSGSISSVQEYLKQYPKGRFAGQAKILIANLKSTPKPAELVATPTITPGRADGENDLWTEAQKGNSKDDYDAYLAQYPKGKYVALARSRIKKLQDEADAEASRKEQEAWEAADKSSSEDGYKNYLKGWPGGKYAGLAQVRIKKLQADIAEQTKLREEDAQWKRALGAATRASMQAYLEKYPNGRYVTEARQKDEEYQRIPPRPQIPVTVSEDIWRTIESSDYYRNLPRPRAIKINYSEKKLFKYDDPGKKGFSSASQTSNITEPLSDRCFVLKNKQKYFAESNSGETTTEYESYSCGFINLGTTMNGKAAGFIKSIDELKGSLFPMHVGARLLIRTQSAYIPDRKFDSKSTLSLEVISQGPAHELDSKLSGIAWKIRHQHSHTSNHDNKTSVTDADDYYLEDLGVMLSSIGVLDAQKYILAHPGTVTNRKFDNFSVTDTYSSYDWTVGE